MNELNIHSECNIAFLLPETVGTGVRFIALGSGIKKTRVWFKTFS
jgi:hypothetical protein